MRKQYHLRRVGDGFDAWDVDRLIEATRDLPIEQVPLSAIRELDTAYWFADSGAEATVRNVVEHLQLVLDADLSYPVIVDQDGRVLDGMHRVAQALLEGQGTVACVRLSTLPDPEHRDCQPGDLPYER